MSTTPVFDLDALEAFAGKATPDQLDAMAREIRTVADQLGGIAADKRAADGGEPAAAPVVPPPPAAAAKDGRTQLRAPAATRSRRSRSDGRDSLGRKLTTGGSPA